MRIELAYDGYARVVEVHAYGRNAKAHDVMRVWQVRGGSVHNEPVGWKLLRLDEAQGMRLTSEPAQVPRQGYRPGDRDMTLIYAQL